MDYGKFKYEEKKKASDAKRAQVTVLLKEVKFRPKTEDHDYEFKVRNMRRFIEDGNKAKAVVQFRGREITHREQGTAILVDVAEDLKEVAVVEQAPRMEGRLMFMILAPTPKVAQKARERVRQAANAAKRAPLPSEKATGKRESGSANKDEPINAVEGRDARRLAPAETDSPEPIEGRPASQES
jgi:translation initiation factor IF-3